MSRVPAAPAATDLLTQLSEVRRLSLQALHARIVIHTGIELDATRRIARLYVDTQTHRVAEIAAALEAIELLDRIIADHPAPPAELENVVAFPPPRKRK